MGRISIPARATGPLLTLLVIATIEVLVRSGVLNIPNPVLLVLIAVIYAGYSAGLRAGLLSAALAVFYGMYFFSAPGALLQFQGDDATRMAVLVLVAPFLAWMTGALRDRAERALRAARDSEMRYRTLSDLSSDWYWEQDEYFRFVDLSADVVRAAGSSVGSHVGKTRWELPTVGVSEEDWAGHRAVLEAHRPFRDLEFQRVNEAGETIWMSTSGVPIFDDAGGFKGYRGVARNIVERKRVEQALASAKERLQRALVGSRLVLWELDLRTGRAQLGREWAQIVGSEDAPTEVSLAELRKLTHPDDLARLDEAFQSVISGRAEHYDVEQRIRARNGEWKWVQSTGKVAEVDASGRPIRASGTNRDITARKWAQLALRDNERRLRLIIDTVPAMIGYVDAELRYRYCNRRYCKAMSRPESAILGQTVRTVVGDEQYEIARPLLERALAGEQVEYERRHQWPDGTLADLAVTYVPHLAEDGRVLGLYAMLVDLTERKRAERIKELFISMVSHELRTPLTSIIWTLESLTESKTSGMSKEESAAVVLAQQNAERMLHLADEILEIEKIDQGNLHMNPSAVALSELVGRALALNQGLAHKHAVQIGAAQLAAAKVKADPDRLLQVLSNLISNAAKHSPRGGLVEIVIEPRGKMFRTSVKDNGRGVPEQFREMLFGRFAQSSDGRALGGSGLGLAICKEIVERSGGAIGYDPNPEGGSVFWFELPAAPAAGQGG